MTMQQDRQVSILVLQCGLVMAHGIFCGIEPFFAKLLLFVVAVAGCISNMMAQVAYRPDAT